MALILVWESAGREVRRELAPGRHVIGRAPDCDVVVADPSISRKHAEIEVAAGGDAVIRDLGSRNGTWLGGRRLEADAPLRAGDDLRVASLPVRVAGEEPRAPDWMAEGTRVFAGAEVTWRDVAGEGAGESGLPARLFRVLAAAGELLGLARSADELGEEILELVERSFQPERSALLLREAAADDLVVRAARARGARAHEPMALPRSMVRRVLDERTSLLTLDAQSDPRFQAHESVVVQGVRSAMAAPLFDNEDVIGLLYADTSASGRAYSRDELRAFALLANLVAVKITQARLAESEHENRRLAHEVQAAREIIERALPAAPPVPDGWDLAVRLQPCSEVGGDFYDVRPLADGRTALVLGDVAGKGLGAALLASNVLSVLGVLLAESADLCATMARLNRRVWDTAGPLRFATLFLGILDPRTGRLEYVNAGHVPPLVVPAGGGLATIATTGLPVGLMDEGFYATGELTLAPDDLLVVCSDGIPEAWNGAEEDYGTERLTGLLDGLRGRGAAEVADAVTADVARFLAGAPAPDDVTLLLLRRA